jgi:general secretion pathway protein I
MTASHAHRGFTLVEIMVALAIVAVALTAGMRATGSLTQLSQRQQDQLLAQLCADNALAAVRLSRTLPGIGTSSQSCVQAGQSLEVVQDVLPTPNPNFRRVDVRVRPGDTGNDGMQQPINLMFVSTVVGRY